MTEKVTTLPNYDTQRERWIKYGANVALVTLIVIALAVAIVYLAEKKPKRIDTTSTGLYSLKPQTLSVIKSNTQPITLISLYTHEKKDSNSDDTTDDTAVAKDVDQPAIVADLLEEYHARGSKIEVQVIDPIQNPSKKDDLIRQVEDQYSGEVKKYRTFADSVPDKYAGVSKLADDEVAQLRKVFEGSAINNEQLYNTVMLAAGTVEKIPKAMKDAQDNYKQFLRKKPPDYKGITDDVSNTMQTLSTLLGLVNTSFDELKGNKDLPAPVKQYITDSAPRYAEIKKRADDIIAEVKGLGELKLDTLRTALQQRNTILVRGEKEWRVIPYEKVWRTDQRDMHARSDEAVRPRFAGEQMVTTAILSLNQPVKQKICFVRAGGPPLTDFGSQLSSMADRLRDYNFDVSDKDLTGMYAMQAMQQQMPAAPEPSDADIEDAIWVVDGQGAQSNPMMGGPPPSIAPKVADHIAKGFHYENGKKVPGGCAFFLFMPEHSDNMQDVLGNWGITAHTDCIAVHKLITASGGDADDVNRAEKSPPIFALKEWGTHPITETMGSLPGVLIGGVPITVKTVDGITTTQLIPVPGGKDAWGETDLQTVSDQPKFDKDVDLPGPLFCAAAAEKKDGTRIVVAGSEPMFSPVVDYPDPQWKKRGVTVPMFPGNSEFFMNSMFWLSHQESLMAMSPAAMNVSRINDMSSAAEKFWKYGVLLVGLPGLVLLAGVGVFFARRD